MGISLNGLTPANTYQSLIKVGDNSQLTATLKTLSDGFGTDLPMQVSTSGVNFTGTVTQNGNPITTNPSGVSGAIQFSNGSAFASDAANLFWDDTNNRLGIGTNAPSHALTIDANTTDDGLIMRGQTDTVIFQVTKDGNTVNSSELFQYSAGAINFALRSPGNASYFNNGTFTFGANTNLGAKVNIKGSGSTSATTSLLVQNSAGAETFKVQDNGVVVIENFTFVSGSVIENTTTRLVATTGGVAVNSNYAFANSSSILDVASTTKGFLPPRMTTTQKNAISTPASGLMVYDTDTNKLCCYNGTSWNDLF
jgi:hypothetical protein